jgi:hypothetical protein
MQKKASGRHAAKAGNKNKGKSSPRGAKLLPRNAPKAAPKRQMEPPSSSAKRRRTATDDGRVLRGKEAEAALEQYGKEEKAGCERLEQEDDEYNEQNKVREEGNQSNPDGIPNLSRPLRRPFTISSPLTRGPANDVQVVDLEEQIESPHVSTNDMEVEARVAFVAPTAPMTKASPPKDLRRAHASLLTPPAQSPLATQTIPEARTLSQQTRRPKSKVSGDYRIITYQQPDHAHEIQWKNGQFKGKSLSTVIEEVSHITGKRHIEELKLRLETFFWTTDVSVLRGDEKSWEDAQRDFGKKIKDAFTRDSDRGGKFKIWIEPIYAENAMSGENDDENSEDLDW